jgi:hypothetical protein
MDIRRRELDRSRRRVYAESARRRDSISREGRRVRRSRRCRRRDRLAPRASASRSGSWRLLSRESSTGWALRSLTVASLMRTVRRGLPAAPRSCFSAKRRAAPLLRAQRSDGLTQRPLAQTARAGPRDLAASQDELERSYPRHHPVRRTGPRRPPMMDRSSGGGGAGGSKKSLIGHTPALEAARSLRAGCAGVVPEETAELIDEEAARTSPTDRLTAPRVSEARDSIVLMAVSVGRRPHRDVALEQAA